jgi:hypothetical protein
MSHHLYVTFYAHHMGTKLILKSSIDSLNCTALIVANRIRQLVTHFSETQLLGRYLSLTCFPYRPYSAIRVFLAPAKNGDQIIGSSLPVKCAAIFILKTQAWIFPYESYI